jgi:glycosyltransferase involved in cell wall biosynthesis
MKIALVSFHFPTIGPGGAGTFNYELGKALMRKGHQVDFVVPNGKELDTKTVSCNYLNLPMLRYFSFCHSAAQKLKHKDYDIIHVDSGAGFFIKSPDVTTIHHVPAFNKNKMLGWNFYRASIDKSRFVMTMCNQTKAEMVQKGVPAHKIRLVSEGIDFSRFRPCKRNSFSKSLLYIGWLTKRKNPQLLVKLLKNLPDANLTVVGKGSEFSSLKRMAALSGVASRMKFAGWVSEKELPRYYQNADLFVFPSLKEGFGLVLLESAACGTTFLAFNVGISKELSDNSIGITAESEEDFIEKAQNFFESPYRLTNKHLDYLRKNYSWDSVAEQVLKIYREVKHEDSPSRA